MHTNLEHMTREILQTVEQNFPPLRSPETCAGSLWILPDGYIALRGI
jgi:hypothetical protein